MQDEVAIKLYTNTAGFSNEQILYAKKEVVQAAGKPPAFVNNADRTAVTPYGFVFPPFTVAEKAQPLAEWNKRFQADVITSMQVCSVPVYDSPTKICLTWTCRPPVKHMGY